MIHVHIQPFDCCIRVLYTVRNSLYMYLLWSTQLAFVPGS